MENLNEIELKECNGGGTVVSRTPYNDDAIGVYAEIFDAGWSFARGIWDGIVN